MIAVDGLTVRVGGFTLDNVSFTVPNGAYGVVIGPAGSGKTTLLESIAGLLPLRSGRVALAGADVTRLPPERRPVATGNPLRRTGLRGGAGDPGKASMPIAQFVGAPALPAR